METTIDSVSIQIESNSSKASESIDKLVASINKIKNATTVGIQGLNNLNIAINNIKTSFNNLNVNNLDKTTQKMKELKNTAKTLSGKFTVPKIETGTISNDKLISSTEQYGKLIKKEIVDGQVRAKTYRDISNGIQTTTTITGKAITQTQKYVNEQSKLTKALKVFKGLGIAQILKGIFNVISNLTGQSAKYIADVNYFNTSMGEMQKDADEFVNNMSKDFYLDPGNLRRYMASFNTLIKGFGIGSEEAYKMSKNLTQLSYDYSALTGIDVEDMMQKLKSGISGELEPMRAIGIALDQNTLQLTANTLGIKKKVSAMTRAQKTELLYYQIMKSTEYAQNAFSRSLALSTEELKNSSKVTLTPATALSILKQQYTQLGRAIGNIFIPILVRMTPYVIAVTQLLTQAAQAIAAFFGFKITDYSIGSGLDNVSSGIEDIGNAADDTKKKAKAMLAPFDELNSIDFGNKSSGIGSSVGGGSLGLDLKEYDWLKSDKLTNKVEDIKKKFDMVKDVVIAIGTAILTWKIGKKIVDFFDKLGVLQKTDGLKFLAGLSLTISGITLIYNGLKKIMNGEVTAENVLEVAFGGALTYVGASLMFKTPVSIGVTLALMLDIVLLTSIIGWWNKYYDQTKQELYKNKKDLNLGEFINVSFTAIGTGVENTLSKTFGEDFVEGIKDWFRKHDVARDVLGVFLELFTHADLSGFKTQGGIIADNIIDGIRKVVWGKDTSTKISGTIDILWAYLSTDMEKMLLKLADLVEHIPIVGTGIANSIRAGVSASKEDVSNTIKYTNEEALKEANPWVKTKAEETGRSALKSYNSGFSDEAVSSSEDIRKSLESGFTSNESNLRRTANITGNRLSSSVGEGFNSQKENLNGIFNKTISSGFTNNESNLKRTANTTGNRLGSSTVNGFNSHSSDWNKAGKNINSGVAAGINNSNSQWSLKRAISNLAGNALSWFKSKLGIHSPSTVMRDFVGKFIPLGVAEGIDDEAKSVYDSISNMSNAMVASFDVNYDDINGNISTQTQVKSNIDSYAFATTVGEYCYNAITQGFEDNPSEISVNIGNDKVYSGMATYENYQSNKYGTTRVKV